MRCFVVVNEKFIVAVDSTSNGGAEHVVLDNYNGVCGALAFSSKELGTDMFAHYMNSCEMVSLKELVEVMNAYDVAKIDLMLAEDDVVSLRNKRDEIIHKLEEAEIRVSDLRGKYRKACAEIGLEG